MEASLDIAATLGGIRGLTGLLDGAIGNDAIELSGAASRSRFDSYRPNPNGMTRTASEAVELASARGVVIPDDIDIQFGENWTRTDANAEYSNASARYPNANSKMTWDDFYHEETGMIPVRLNPAIANSDEALVANISHEMYELNKLREKFDATPNGEISAGQVGRMINPNDHPTFPGAQGNLHEQAWDASDKIIYQIRRELGLL